MIIDLKKEAIASVKSELLRGAVFYETDSMEDALGRLAVEVVPQGSGFRYVFLTEWAISNFKGEAEFTNFEADSWEVVATDEPYFAGEEIFTQDVDAVFAAHCGR